MNIYLTMLGMVVVTFIARAAPFLLLRGELPLWLKRWLGFVPVAVFVALILPPLLLQEDGGMQRMAFGPALPAGIVGALVAWRTNNVLLTIAAGLVSFWVLQALQ